MSEGDRRRARPFLTAALLVLALWLVASLETLFSRSFAGGAISPYLVSLLPAVFARCRVWLVVAGAALVLYWRFRPVTADGGEKAPAAWIGLLADGFLGLACLVLIVTRALQFPVSMDDSYIDYRYIQGFLDHGQLEWNPGEKVIGFTAHLRIVMIAVMAMLTGVHDLSVVSQSLNIGYSLAGFFALHRYLLEVLGRPFWAIAGCWILALDPYLIREVGTGKETPLIALLVLLSLFAWERGRRYAFATCAGLLFLTRPEGVFWLAVAVLASIRADGRRFWKPWVPVGSVVLFWYLSLFVVYGTILPHGWVAKRVMYHGYPRFLIMGYLLEVLAGPFTGLTFNHLETKSVILITVFGIPIALALLWILRFRSSLRLYGTAIAVIAGFFAVTNSYPFPWYLCWFGLAPVLAVPTLGRRIADWGRVPLPLVGVLLSTFVLVSPLARYSYTPGHCGADECCPVFWWSDYAQRLLLYRDAALHLNAVRDPPGVVGTAEPGAFGYWYKGKVIDLGGLVSDEMLPFFPVPPEQRTNVSYYSIPVRAVHELPLDYVLFFECFAINGISADPQFVLRYHPYRLWPSPVFVGRGLWLFAKT